MTLAQRESRGRGREGGLEPALPVLLAGQRAAPLAGVLGLDRGERCVEAQQQGFSADVFPRPPQAGGRFAGPVPRLRRAAGLWPGPFRASLECMARTINQSFLLGNLGGDAEFRTLASGEELATLRLATSRSYRRPDGDCADETEWHDVVVPRPPQAGGRWKADRLRDHRDRLRKGDQVHVAGRLRTRTWEDREGHKRQRTEVACFAGDVILLAPAQGAGADPGEEAAREAGSPSPGGSDDAIPF